MRATWASVPCRVSPSSFEIDPGRLAVGIRESDSHYHMKYTHQQSARVVRPQRHDIPPRIQAHIEAACAWYYQLYYAAQR